MPTIRDMITRFGFEVDKSSLDKARDMVRGFANRTREAWMNAGSLLNEKDFERVRDATDDLNKSWKDFANTLKPVAVAIAGIGATGAGLLYLARETANYTDQIADTSKQIGITTDQLQSLTYAAQLSGAGFEELTTGVRLLSNQLQASKLDPGGSTAQVFRRLGVAVVNASGHLRGADSVLYDISNRFAKMKDGVEKTALAQDLFGRTGAKLIPLLSEGADGIRAMQEEAFKLGLVLDGDAIEAGNKFNDSIDTLKATLVGLRNVIFSEFTPVLKDMTDEFREWISENREMIKADAVKFIKEFIGAAKWLWSVFKEGVRITREIINAFGGLENVVKIATTAFSLFAGYRTLAAFNQVIVAAKALETAVRGLGLAGAIASAEIAAIPLAIAAIAAGVYLIFDDVLTYFEGGESVTGFLVNSFKRGWAWLSERFPKTTAFLETVFGLLKDIWNVLSWTIPPIGIARLLWMFANKADIIPQTGKPVPLDEARTMQRVEDAQRAELGPKNYAPPANVVGTAADGVTQNYNFFGLDQAQLLETIKRETEGAMGTQLQRAGIDSLPRTLK